MTSQTLEQDARLDAPVTLNKIAIPFSELLQSLSSKTLNLSVTRSCNGQKLQIRLKQRPLRVLMQALAELMPGEWMAQEDGSGYLFRMSPEAVRKRQRWWDLFMSEREKALAAQRAFVLQNLRGQQPQSQQFTLEPEQKEVLKQGRDFFSLLSPDMQERFAEQMNEAPFYQSQGSFGTWDSEGALVLPVTSLSPASQELMRSKLTGRIPTPAASTDWSQTYVQLMNGGFSVQACVILPDGRNIGTVFSQTFNPPSIAQALLTPDHAGLPEIVQRLGNRAPEGWKQLAAYQLNRVWPNTLPPPPASMERRKRRSEILQWLGCTADMEYVADYYSQEGAGMTSAEKKTFPVRSLNAELNYHAVREDFSWKQAGSLRLIRDNRWYRNDWLEVPTATLRRWQPVARLRAEHRQPSATIEQEVQQRVRQLRDWQADVVTALSPWQIGSGLKFAREEPSDLSYDDFVNIHPTVERMARDNAAPLEYTVPWDGYPFWQDVETMFSGYNLRQFYAILTAEERDALSKQQLEFANLASDKQARALYLLPRLRVWKQQHPSEQVRLGLRLRLPAGIVPRGAVMGSLEFYPISS